MSVLGDSSPLFQLNNMNVRGPFCTPPEGAGQFAVICLAYTMSLRDIYEDGFDEESGKTIRANTCPECAGRLVTDGGEISCTACGLIVEEQRLDHGPEWTTFGDDTTTRTGAPLTPARHDRGLSTEIGYGGDAKGNPLAPHKRRQIARLRREHTRARWGSTAERNLADACTEIARLTSALDLPRGVREEAALLYRRAHHAGLIQGRSIETMAAGSVYAACRCRGYPRSIAEVAAVARCREQKVQLGYRVLNTELGLEAAVVEPHDHVPGLATACAASETVRRRALDLATLAAETGLATGCNPAGVAAACLYLAGREGSAGHTQAELARLADVTPATLRARYYELRDAGGHGREPIVDGAT